MVAAEQAGARPPAGLALGESQWAILDHLKRNGGGSVPELAASLDLNVETIRTHLRSLEGRGWVQRTGQRREGPGRPEIVFGLTTSAEALFPNRESELLVDLVAHLRGDELSDELDRFFEDRVGRRREAALARVEGLEGRERLDRVADILTEQGFMAEVRHDEDGSPTLRLCHCPMRAVVEVTRAPCRAELGFVRELLGDRLSRVMYIPAGAPACCYRVGES